jgi:uncharacterized protein DUF1214
MVDMAIAARSTLRWFRDARLSAVECRLDEMRSLVAGPGNLGMQFHPCKALENLPVYPSVMFITRLSLVEAARLQAECVEICSGQAVLGEEWCMTSRPWAFIYNPWDRVGPAATTSPTMKADADYSVDLLIGPKAPKDLESNWIPTPGKRPLPVMRLYGGNDAFWDTSFKMPDVELAD